MDVFLYDVVFCIFCLRVFVIVVLMIVLNILDVISFVRMFVYWGVKFMGFILYFVKYISN